MLGSGWAAARLAKDLDLRHAYDLTVCRDSLTASLITHMPHAPGLQAAPMPILPYANAKLCDSYE